MTKGRTGPCSTDSMTSCAAILSNAYPSASDPTGGSTGRTGTPTGRLPAVPEIQHPNASSRLFRSSKNTASISTVNLDVPDLAALEKRILQTISSKDSFDPYRVVTKRRV